MELAIPNTSSGRSKCSMYAVNFTDILQSGFGPNEDWPIKPCSHGWEYSLIDIPYATIATEV